MNKAQEYLNKLIKIVEEEKEIKGYILTVSVYSDLQTGFLNKEVGGIYRPIQSTNSLSGYYYFELSNGKFASGKLNPSTWEDFSTFFKFVKLAEYEDVHPITIPGKSSLELPKLFYPEIKEMIQSDPDKLLNILDELKKENSHLKNLNVEGFLGADYIQSAIATSNGLSKYGEITNYNIATEYNSSLFFSEYGRNILDMNKISSLVEIYSKRAEQILEKKVKQDEGEYTILIDKYQTYSFLNKFFLENIDGKSVDSGLAKFAKEDFKSNKKVFGNELSISVNQLEDLSLDSILYTDDGILPAKFDLVKNGNLIQPVCDWKSGRELGFDSHSLSSLLRTNISTDKDVSYEDFIKENPKFIYVYSMLGMHTQNSVLGKYSVPCPVAFLFENGEVVAPVNIIISGDIFEKFLSEDFYFVKQSFYDKSLLTFNSHVTFAE